MHITPDILDHITRSLTEDIGPDLSAGDLTTNAVIGPDQVYKARIFAKEPIYVAGIDVAKTVFQILDKDFEITPTVKDGDLVDSGQTILTLSGAARTILTGERVALNYLQHLSGIATLTAKYAAEVKNTKTRVLDTRKTIPGLRLLEKYAVTCGGGMNHRIGLYDKIMIKDNHVLAAGNLGNAIAACQANNPQNMKIQAECDTLEQVKAALDLGLTDLLLDNMTIDQLSQAVSLNKGRATLEASGGVTLKTIGAIAQTGVDFISVGRLTQSAPAVDLSLEIIEN